MSRIMPSGTGQVRYADDTVFVVEYSYINAKYCEGLEMFNFERFSLYDVLHEHYRLKIAYTKDEIRADYIWRRYDDNLGKENGSCIDCS
ncbi:MAG: UTRA domain-containing protein [Erysipelotrichaceae bacterium]|nr:UTRA domain-containing protein [Erysipelotrichaceae bacterium]